MDKKTSEYFGDVIISARSAFEDVEYNNVGKHIPHLHLNDKTAIELTEEMTFSDFVQWLKENIIMDQNT